jgi:hypothetical protein
LPRSHHYLLRYLLASSRLHSEDYVRIRVADPDPNWIRIRNPDPNWIRIRNPDLGEQKWTPKSRKKLRNFLF